MRTLELLTGNVVVARRDESLIEAVRKMREQHVGALVVVEDRGGARVPIGMLTDRDVVVGVFAKDVKHADMLRVGEVMTTDLVTATADEDVSDVLHRMRMFGVRRVPVVDATGALEGIVALDDVVAGISGQLAEAASLIARQRDREPARRP